MSPAFLSCSAPAGQVPTDQRSREKAVLRVEAGGISMNSAGELGAGPRICRWASTASWHIVYGNVKLWCDCFRTEWSANARN